MLGFGPSSEFPGEGADGPSLDPWPVQMFLRAGTVRGMESGRGQAVSAGTVCTDGGAGGQKEREWVLERDWRACPLGVCSRLQ